MGTICSKVSIPCIEADAKQAAEEAEQALAFVAKIAGYLNTGTDKLITFLTELKSTITDPKLALDITNAITILEAIKNIALIVSEAPTDLRGFEVPNNTAAIVQDADHAKVVTTDLTKVVTSLNNAGVKTGVSDSALMKLNAYIGSVSSSQNKSPVIFSRQSSLRKKEIPTPSTPSKNFNME